VKTSKHHFYRVVGSSFLNFDELRTLLCHISAVYYYRTLVSISENFANLDVLTPAHFLNGGPPLSFIEPVVTNFNFNRLYSWQRVAYLHQIFWSRWKEEYLTLLQQRSKWRTAKNIHTLLSYPKHAHRFQISRKKIKLHWHVLSVMLRWTQFSIGWALRTWIHQVDFEKQKDWLFV